METLEAIRSRRNVRSYKDESIEDEHLVRILEAARRTPSSKNEQRWDFVVVRDKDRLERLSHVWQGARHIPGSAATIALVGPEPDEQRIRESIRHGAGDDEYHARRRGARRRVRSLLGSRRGTRARDPRATRDSPNLVAHRAGLSR